METTHTAGSPKKSSSASNSNIIAGLIAGLFFVGCIAIAAIIMAGVAVTKLDNMQTSTAAVTNASTYGTSTSNSNSSATNASTNGTSTSNSNSSAANASTNGTSTSNSNCSAANASTNGASTSNSNSSAANATVLSAFVANFEIPAHNYAPEGIFWDTTSQQFLFGSLYTGGVYSLRPGTSDLGSQILTFVEPNTIGLGSLGVYVDTGSSRYNLWTALARFPPNANLTTSGGLMYANLVTGATTSLSLDLFRRDGLPLLINDVVTDPDGNAFATNSFDGQIFKASYNSTTNAIDAIEFFNNTAFRFSSFGFNGIEYYNGFLLVGILQDAASGGGILRVNSTDPTQYQMVSVTSGVIDQIDGMRFNADKTVLYMVRNPDKLVAAVSTDNWATAQVIQNFTIPSNCSPFLSTIAYVPSVQHGYVMCTASFSAGPYQIAQFN